MQRGGLSNLDISIHAPRVGSDAILRRFSRGGVNFNPRSPCGERPRDLEECSDSVKFQSTLPVWGATSQQLRPLG